MVTGASLSVTSANIALFSKTNENSLAESLVRLASGKRVNRPADGISEFFFSEKLKRNKSSDTDILQNIAEARAFTDVATAAGESLFEAVSDMRNLVKQYYHPDTDQDEKDAITVEFNALKNTAQHIIQSSMYDGERVISDNGGTPFRTVRLLEGGDSSTELSLKFDAAEDIADVSGLTLGVDEAAEKAAVETEYGKAGSYLAKTSAYDRGLNAHYAIVNNRMTTESENSQRTVEASTGDEYVQAMNKSIRNEAALAMLAQANMYRTSIVRLFG